MKDYLVRGYTEDGAVRIFAAVSTQMVEHARQIHHTSPTATAALGRTLTAGSMMGAMMKNASDVLTIIIKGDGPLGGIVATAQADGYVRGYVYNPEVWIPLKSPGHLDVGGAVGKGTLQVIKDTGLKEPYSGQIELVSGELAEDFTYYFAASEQTPSSVGLGVLVDTDGTVKQAGGFVIQLMPFASDEVITALEEKLKVIPSVTQMLEQGMTPEDMVQELVGMMNPTIADSMDIGFRCSCSRERVENALLATGARELFSMYEENKPLDANCQFCESVYTFTHEDIGNLLKKAGIDPEKFT